MGKYSGKTILITGGTGSFGHAMVKRMRKEDCAEIRIFSRDETKQEAMRFAFSDARLRFIIGDVRNPDSVANAMEGVDLVFHAAALKQVPSCEFFPMEAVMTNVIGSKNVVDAAIKQGVENIVCLSTDKAAYPINAMGMTKALMEKVAVAAARGHRKTETVVSVVRYGNVMMSRGSVIPLFINQIKSGQALTLTNPEMTRFLLSLDEAIELVLFAFDHAKTGDLFIKKAAACTVRVLAEAVKKLCDADTEIKVIGTRHGEKLYETLATVEELGRAEDMGDFLRISMDERDLDYSRYVEAGLGDILPDEDYHSHNTKQIDVDEVLRLIQAIAT